MSPVRGRVVECGIDSTVAEVTAECGVERGVAHARSATGPCRVCAPPRWEVEGGSPEPCCVHLRLTRCACGCWHADLNVRSRRWRRRYRRTRHGTVSVDARRSLRSGHGRTPCIHCSRLTTQFNVYCATCKSAWTIVDLAEIHARSTGSAMALQYQRELSCHWHKYTQACMETPLIDRKCVRNSTTLPHAVLINAQ